MLHKPFGRRRFLQTATLFSTGLITSLAHAHLKSASAEPAKDEPVKAIVIGSGFGGAIAALRLGQAGINTILLERGRRWDITPDQNTFATFQKPDGRAAWLSPTTYDGVPVNVYTGVLELRVEDGINVLCGAGYGGGSLVYNSIIYKPHRELFYKVFPHSINYEELTEVYYPRVHSILKPSPLPNDLLATDYYERTRLFIQQATAAGFQPFLQDIGVDWDKVREEIKGTRVPSAITGNDWYGNNSGAKKSLDQNYLAQAEQTGCVEVLTLHMVTEITEVPDYGYRVSCIQINEIGEVVAQKSFTCRHLFLAAGSMGTSKLLVKAKAKGTLPRLNNYVGKYWGNNGDTVGSRSNLPPVSHVGGPASAVFEDLSNPYAPTTIEYVPTWNAPDVTLQSISLSLAPAIGTFTYDASTDSVKLTWPKDSPANQNIQSAMKQTYETLDNGNTTPTSKPTTQLFPDLTAHPLGGSVIGKVCDSYGRVFGHQGLYIVDGALIPGSTGCTNPAFTIAALAERCMDKIIPEIK